MEEPQVKGSLWVRVLAWTFIVSIVAGVATFGVVVFIVARSHTRMDPQFRGFRGAWSLDTEGGAKENWGRLDIGPEDHWLLIEWTPTAGEIRDEGTWKELPDDSYEMKSRERIRIAKFESGDEWVLYIDGAKYRRIVK